MLESYLNSFKNSDDNTLDTLVIYSGVVLDSKVFDSEMKVARCHEEGILYGRTAKCGTLIE